MSSPVETNVISKRRRVASQAAWGTASEGTVAIGSLVMFLGLATSLERADFGVIASVQGLVTPVISLSLAGAPILMTRRISVGQLASESYHRAVGFLVVGPVLATLLLIAFRPLLLGPVAPAEFALLAVAYGVLIAAQNLQYQFTVAVESMRDGFVIRTGAVVARLVGLLVLVWGGSTIEEWARIAVVANLAGAVFGALVVARLHGVWPRLRSGGVVEDARQGWGFAVNGLSEGILDASDRPILLNSGYAVAAGDYGIASRSAALALVPTFGVMGAISPSLFRAGALGRVSGVRAGVRYLPIVMATGGGAAVILYFGSGLMPLVLDEADDVVSILQWLSVVPLIKAIQYHGGNVYDCLGMPLVRFVGTLLASAGNLFGNLLLIPTYGWPAAVGTTLAAEAALAVGFWIGLLFMARSRPNADPLP